MKIFISYAHVDKDIVLESIIEILSEAGHRVWYDNNLNPGEEWEAQLLREISNSDAFLFAMTPTSVKSDYCRWEYDQAKKFKKPIFSVLLTKGTPIPLFLNKIQYVDFSDGASGRPVAKLMRGLDQVSGKRKPIVWIAPIVLVIALILLVLIGTNLTGNTPVSEPIINTATITALPTETPTVTNTPTDEATATATYIPSPTPHLIHCGDIIQNTFPHERDYHFYSIGLSELDLLTIRGEPIGENLKFYLLLKNPVDSEIAVSAHYENEEGTLNYTRTISQNPEVNSGMLSASGIYKIIAGNDELLRPEEKQGGIGTYTLYVSCVLKDGTVIEAGDNFITETLPPTLTSTPTNTPLVQATVTQVSTDTPAQCTGKIPGVGGMINQVKVLPNPSSPSKSPVQRGVTVIILDTAEDFGSVWYQIQYGDNVGWIPEEYVDIPSNCS